jgi:hypothetical protein
MGVNPDTMPLVVLAYVVGAVGVVCGLWVAARGRAQLIRGGGRVRGPVARVLGLTCAAAGAGLAWYILTHPVVRP